ncbi:hypothetical protein F3I16_06570 [Pseudomonas sp. L-22-4S-12]|nr:hypothetical protein [Pseudomonas sp. L-22-4S-12]MWV15713.1 hypothetical protein [Pseudomonas sp. L-22-4S-12]
MVKNAQKPNVIGFAPAENGIAGGGQRGRLRGRRASPRRSSGQAANT